MTTHTHTYIHRYAVFFPVSVGVSGFPHSKLFNDLNNGTPSCFFCFFWSGCHFDWITTIYGSGVCWTNSFIRYGCVTEHSHAINIDSFIHKEKYLNELTFSHTHRHTRTHTAFLENTNVCLHDTLYLFRLWGGGGHGCGQTTMSFVVTGKR